MLLGVAWGIATADEGLRRCAEEFDIYVIGHEELAEMVSRYDAAHARRALTQPSEPLEKLLQPRDHALPLRGVRPIR